MTASPDPADLSPELTDDADDYSLRRRGFGWLFWLMLAFCGLCALGGLAIARFGPQLFPVKAAVAPSKPPSTAPHPDQQF